MKYLLFILLPLVIIEAFLRYQVFSINNVNHDIRNGYFRRNWPQYSNIKANNSGNNTQKIVFIGNSQGFGREIDQELIYTNQLQLLFNINSDNLEVYNWCVPGAIGHELFILTAKAISLGFDHIIITMFVNNFSKETTSRPLSYSISDVPAILGEKSVYDIIPKDFLEKYSNNKGYYPYLFERYVYISKFNKIIKDYAMKYTDKKETFWWRKTEPVALGNNNKYLLGHIEEFDENYFMYFDKLFAIAGMRGSKITLLIAPLSEKLIDKKDLHKLYKFNDFVKGHYKETRIGVVDMMNVLDDNYYYSYSHFSQYNHKLFADKLYEWYVFGK